MKRLLHILACLAVVAATTLTASGQEPDKRHVTPVKPETNRVQPPPKGTDEKIIQQYITGDTATALEEARKDSLRRVYHHYPLLTDITVGVNFAEPLFMAFGQSYASADVNVTLNMWNRLQPTIEAGLGWAKSTPAEEHFTYHGKPSPYFKVGANYNFLFKNPPDHQAFVGVRLGYSTFSYDVDYPTATVTEEDGGQSWPTSVKDQHSHALWGEACLGLKVRLFGPLSMGWSIRYHGVFSYDKKDNGQPWFIPGYGPRTGSLGFTMGLYYTL